MVDLIGFEGEVIKVEYNSDLDPIPHKGLAQLKNGWFVLIQRSKSGDIAEVISDEIAVQEILKSGNIKLFDKYPELKLHRELKEA